MAAARPDGPRGRLITLEGVEGAGKSTQVETLRAWHVQRVIRPALAAGQIVLCDRYVDSTVAYQGYGSGLPLETIAQLNRLATDGVLPDMTLMLDLDVAEGLRRVRARHGALATCDPFERLAIEFHERVRKGYWAIRDREPERVTVVDADRPPAVVAAEIARLVAQRLGLAA